jgi:hypothetical protein
MTACEADVRSTAETTPREDAGAGFEAATAGLSLADTLGSDALRLSLSAVSAVSQRSARVCAMSAGGRHEGEASILWGCQNLGSTCKSDRFRVNAVLAPHTFIEPSVRGVSRVSSCVPVLNFLASIGTQALALPASWGPGYARAISSLFAPSSRMRRQTAKKGSAS